ncbi:HNH endonuclease signature motif containing protein [Arthrobacter sulfonylureivorans]|uniref:HNH endonuclease n=1 Tax=Arthrobacter sulfonylureivorans TaxID=2486855 RepID=A0ABY3W8H1_9MICC|nr:HNH endonuclease signature motif containing protein [Arthrobacter sulfonylureivorans]UNK46635.1 HNH endonuclease [Arthrobacter sulfonylureivorans]
MRRLDYLKAAARVEAWVQSCQVQALNRFALLRTGQGGDRDPEGFSRFAPQEISAHLSTGEAAARTMLADASQICTNLPGTLQAMSRGDLDLARAKALARGSADLPAECLEDFEAAVLPGARDITLDSVRSRARRMRDRLHPESLSERHRRANESRDLQLTDQDDGMAELWIRMSADKAHLVFDRIQSTARSLQGPGENRTLPQLRADVFSDLLLTGAVPAAEQAAPAAVTSGAPGSARRRPGSAGPGLLVTMPLTALLGLSEEPGDLAGHGPIPPDMGRQLSQLAKSWLLVLTDDQGQAIAAAKKLRIPPEWLKRLVRIRDRRCRFPGCRRAARYCEIDHVIAWEDGGWTVLENLQCLCKAHHAAKTAGASSAEAGPNGQITWTTRTGHRKTTFPDEGWDSVLPHIGPREGKGEAQVEGEGKGTASSVGNTARAGDGKPKRTLGGIELPDDEDTDPNAPPPF